VSCNPAFSLFFVFLARQLFACDSALSLLSFFALFRTSSAVFGADSCIVLFCCLNTLAETGSLVYWQALLHLCKTGVDPHTHTNLRSFSMTSATHRYSLANPPPTQGELDGRETVKEADILEVQALQAEHEGDGGRGIQLMERALQIRCQVVNQLRERWANAPETVQAPLTASNASHRMSTLSIGPMSKDDVLREYQAQCNDLYDAAERLVVCCNTCGVDHFKSNAFDAATPLLEYAMQLTEDDAYPLCEVEERRRHLRGVTLNNLGCMERRRGHFSEALNYMKASMDMTGMESPVAYMNMSAILIQLRLNDEAVRTAERSIALLSQTPEDPSLLAVAHHNLAMALEPVDPQRCVEEYELAYQVSCTTLGKDSPTSQSIQHSWERFQRTRSPVPPTGSRIQTPRVGGAAAITSPLRHSLVAGGGHYRGAVSPLFAASSQQLDSSRHAATTPAPADVAEIFPHPFLLTASAPHNPHALLQPSKAASMPSRLAAPTRRAPRQATPEKTCHHPSPPLATRPSSSSSRAPAAAAASRPGGRGNSCADGRSHGGFVPSPPSHSKASTASSAASRRFSASRAAESSSSRPPVPQQHLSQQGGSAKKMNNGRRLSPLKTTTTRTTTTTSASSEAPGPQHARPSHVPRRPAERTPKGAASTTSPPPPRVLPPLQSSDREGEATAPTHSTHRPSRNSTARASTSQHTVSVAASMEDDPLVFLQNRLDVLLQDEEELEQKYVHASTIQRHYRGHLARRRVAELRALRDRNARLAELRRHMAARQIQQAYRRHQRHQRRYPFGAGHSTRYTGSRRSAQHQAATQVQRVARGWLARRRYTQLRQLARDSPIAAARIQRWYRGVRAQRQHAALLAQKAQQEAEVREQEQQQYAATLIQGRWRAYSKQKAYETDLRNRMTARAAEEAQRRVQSAVRIQSAWRGSQARKLYRKTFSRSSQLRAARQEYEQRREAAVKLQAFGRMIIAQHHSLPLLTAARLRAAKDINTRTREGRAAQVIQRAYRGHAARRLYAEKKAIRDAQLQKSSKLVHALTLQRVGRGCVARKSIEAELSALQGEAARYERRLRALEQGDAVAARVASEKTLQLLLSLQLTEGEKRADIVVAEQKERHTVQHHCEIARENMAAEERERQAMRASVIPVLGDFARIVKAKQQRTQRQSARDAYLDQCGAEEEAAHEDASARVVTAFVRSAGARNVVQTRADAVRAYNDARVLQEAEEEEDKSARVVTAFMRSAGACNAVRLRAGAVRKYNDARVLQEVEEDGENTEVSVPRVGLYEERELSQSDTHRPLTAQQIAEERVAIDRLAATEEGATRRELRKDARCISDSDKAAAAAEGDEEEEEALLAQQRAVWQTEEKASKQRRQAQEALHQAMFDYKQQRIAAAAAEKDLLPYSMGRVRLHKRAATNAAVPSQATPWRAASQEVEATAQNLHRQHRLAQEREAVHTIERYYTGYKDRSHFAALQQVRDEYLAAQQETEQHEGPVLVNERLREVKALNPPLEKYQQKHTIFAPEPKRTEPASPSPASSPAETLDGFARIVKAKQQRTQRQSARDAYLDQCGAEEEAAHEDASARVVTAFVRSAGARNVVQTRADAVRAYNDARVLQEAEEEEDKSARVVTAFMRSAGACNAVRLRAGAVRKYNDARVLQEVEEDGENTEVSVPRVGLYEERELSQSDTHRPLTAQQIAEERVAIDRLAAMEELESQYGSNPVVASGSTRLLHQLNPSQLGHDADYELCSDDATATAPPPRERRCPTSTEARACLRGFAQGIAARKELRRRQASRDAYLCLLNNEQAVKQDRVEADIAASRQRIGSSSESAEEASSFADPDGIRAIYREERMKYASIILDGLWRVVKAKQQRTQRQSARDAYLDQCGAEEEAAHEDASARVVTAFMRSAGARNVVQTRADAVRAYNDARVLQEERDNSEGPSLFRKGSDQHRSSFARSNSPAEEEKFAAALKIQQCFKQAQARRQLDALRQARLDHLEEEMAVEELLHTAALAIQCAYRGHRARQQAAMATVRRDLYLLSLEAETDCAAATDEQDPWSSAATAGGAVEHSPFSSQHFSLTEGRVNNAHTFSTYTDNEVTSTAIVMEVDEAEGKAMDRML
jgi:hypothetical protein